MILVVFFTEPCLCNRLLQMHSVLALLIHVDMVSMMSVILMAGVTPAEKLLDLYNGKWGRSVDPVFEELLY